jgi:hypothetical protein
MCRDIRTPTLDPANKRDLHGSNPASGCTPDITLNRINADMLSPSSATPLTFSSFSFSSTAALNGSLLGASAQVRNYLTILGMYLTTLHGAHENIYAWLRLPA